MATTKRKIATRRKPAVKSTCKTTSKKKPVATKSTARKTTTKVKTWYVVDSKGKKTNLKIIAK